jgi:hypothetical protein
MDWDSAPVTAALFTLLSEGSASTNLIYKVPVVEPLQTELVVADLHCRI